MYFYPGNANLLRSDVTVSHGASVAGTATASVSATVPNADVGDLFIVTPQAQPASGILVQTSGEVSVSNQVVITIANVGTATVAAGTAVVYGITLIKPSGTANSS